MKVIYLDIDGVLLPDVSPMLVDIPVAIAIDLHRIIAATGAAVVVSSQRRRSAIGVGMTLATAGVRDTHFHTGAWSTPFLSDDALDDALSVRGQEIKAHADRFGVSNYVIIDDMPVLADQRDRHIQPDPRVGLTSDQADIAIAILNA